MHTCIQYIPTHTQTCIQYIPTTQACICKLDVVHNRSFTSSPCPPCPPSHTHTHTHTHTLTTHHSPHNTCSYACHTMQHACQAIRRISTLLKPTQQNGNNQLALLSTPNKQVTLSQTLSWAQEHVITYSTWHTTLAHMTYKDACTV